MCLTHSLYWPVKVLSNLYCWVPVQTFFHKIRNQKHLDCFFFYFIKLRIERASFLFKIKLTCYMYYIPYAETDLFTARQSCSEKGWLSSGYFFNILKFACNEPTWKQVFIWNVLSEWMSNHLFLQPGNWCLLSGAWYKIR